MGLKPITISTPELCRTTTLVTESQPVEAPLKLVNHGLATLGFPRVVSCCWFHEDVLVDVCLENRYHHVHRPNGPSVLACYSEYCSSAPDTAHWSVAPPVVYPSLLCVTRNDESGLNLPSAFCLETRCESMIFSSFGILEIAQLVNLVLFFRLSIFL